MSIVRAYDEDLSNIISLHKDKSNGYLHKYIDFFYKNYYDNLDMYLNKEEGIIEAMLNVRSFDIFLNSQLIKVDFLSNKVYVNNQEKLDELIIKALENNSYKTLITYSLYDENLYKFGFEPIFYQRQYLFKKGDVNGNTDGVREIQNYDDLVYIYQRFTKRFNGFRVRDLNYFIDYAKEVRSSVGQIVTYYDQNGDIQGYACMLETDKQIIIEECCYLTIAAIEKFVSLALEIRPQVVLKTSASEKLDRVFKNVSFTESPHVMAKINDLSIIQDAYYLNSKSILDLYRLSTKPVYFNEK